MIAPENTALVLLAAGRSTRFGLADKLTQPFLGQPLGLHVVTALEAVPFARRVVIKQGVDLDYAERGYDEISNPRPEDGLSLSIRLGIQHVRDDADAVLIALADMPRITAAHVYRLFEAQHGGDTIVASSDGEHRSPPVLFGSDWFDALETLTGGAGARDLIRAGRYVVTNADELIDIDTEEEMAELRARFGR